MGRIAASIVHPVPAIAARRDGSVRLRLLDARFEGSIEELPPGSMARVEAAFMGRGTTYVAAHGGRLWNRVSTLRIQASGYSQRFDLPAGAFLRELGKGSREREFMFRVGTPLQPRSPSHDAQRAARHPLDPGRPEDARYLPECRAAVAAFLDAVKVCDGFAYVETGLPCLAGCKAPDLAGAGWAWHTPEVWLLTRHDRWRDHARYVGRMQMDDEAERFAYFAGLVEDLSRSTGVAPDDAGARVFANRLPQRVAELLERRARRKAWEDPVAAGMLAAARVGIAPLAALGGVGAIPPDGMLDAIHRTLALASPLEGIDPSLGAEIAPYRAYAEEVVHPTLCKAAPESPDDMDALGSLAP